MKVIDGCTACADMAYNLSDMSFIYPITPSSPMASEIDNLCSKNVKNMFDDTVTVVERSLSTQALSIFGDHQDIYATRQTGFCILASTNVQDAYNLALVAHLSAIKSSLPFLHFFDGFRTSHEYNVINPISQDEIYKLMDFKAINKFRSRALNGDHIITKGMAQNEEIYFQSMEARNLDYQNVPDIVNSYMESINKITKEDYAPFNYYGSKTATNIIVAMVSVCDTIKNVLKDLNNAKYGLIEVHLYRPFSEEYLKKVLPKTVKRIAVLDRTKEAGSIGEPLYLDILSALKELDIQIVGGRYGLSSKNTTPNDIYDVYQMLENKPQNNFVIGIIDDVTKLSIPHYEYSIKNDYREFKIYGFGSDGLVSASKDILKIFASKNYVQGYYEYDSKKSGGVTISHLRLANHLIEAPYYVTSPELVVVTKDEYFHKFEMINNLKPNGKLLINTFRNEEELNAFLPSNVKKYLIDNNIKVYTINAESLAINNGIKGKISLIMEANILNILGYHLYEKTLIDSVKARFKTKGEDIVNANIKCIKESKNNLKEITINLNNGYKLEKAKDIFEQIK